ncbi:MAG TPA: NAD(P)-dependent oxidoreductase [Solirubrobacteraceae bacterium]|nr:NAD(P)-dependent oxidoreductase [Solirubrobacteraceae bacterium]
MILLTGGLGFIGVHTTRALLDAGESCVVAQRRDAPVPELLRPELGDQLRVEQLDVEQRPQLERIGARHSITGIVHLADATVGRLWRRPGDESELALQGLFDGLCNLVQAAHTWGVRRVTVASTIGVYGGVAPGAWSESAALSPVALHAVPTAKRCLELLVAFLGAQLQVNVVSVRPSAIWGPGGRPASSFFALPGLVHAALGLGPQPERPIYAGDAADLCYVRDCGRAIAAVQTTPTLRHNIYNVGSGRLTTNAEVVAALERHPPIASPRLRAGRSPAPPVDPYLDLTRLREDTGFEPEYDIERGIAEYVAWLRSGAGHAVSQL